MIMLLGLLTLCVFSQLLLAHPLIITKNHGTGQKFVQDLTKHEHPDKVQRLRLLVNRIVTSQVGEEGVFPVHHVQLRWTPPDNWYDEGIQMERTYEVECVIQNRESNEERILIDIEVPDEYTGYDERFRLPPVNFAIRCGVRSRNSYDLAAEWTRAPVIHIDNSNFTIPVDYYDDSIIDFSKNKTTYDSDQSAESEDSSKVILKELSMDQREPKTLDDLLNMIHESTLINLTPEVDIEEYKKAGRLHSEIVISRPKVAENEDIQEDYGKVEAADVFEKDDPSGNGITDEVLPPKKVSVDISPPKSVTTTPVLDYAEIEKELVEALNVTQYMSSLSSDEDYFLGQSENLRIIR